MPRDSNGIYTLPVGNPVVSGTVIESVWANTTMTDIAQALTGSMPRDGSAALTGTLQIANGNLSFSGLTQRILGDFSNSSQSQRLLFQTNVVNGFTNVGAIPNGTSKRAQYTVFGNSDPTNSSVCDIFVDGSISVCGIEAYKSGSGTYLPLSFSTGGKQRFEVSTDGICRFHAADAQGGRAHFNRIDDADFAGVIDISTNNEFRVLNVGTAGEAISIGTSSAGGGPLKLLTNGQERIQINAAGNVGIGAVPLGSLSDANRFLVIGDNDSGIGSPGDGRIGIYTNNLKTAEFAFEVLAIKGYSEGGELQLWNNINSKYALIDYYSADNTLRLLNGAGGIRILDGGDVDNFNMAGPGASAGPGKYIGLNAPAWGLAGQIYGEHVGGNWVGITLSAASSKYWTFRNDGNAYGGAWNNISDIRLKKNLRVITGALEKLDKIKGYIYERTDVPDEDDGLEYNKIRAGIVAQEIQEILPEGTPRADEETLAVDPMAVIGFLVQVCKELKAKVVKMDAYLIALAADQNDNPPY